MNTKNISEDVIKEGIAVGTYEVRELNGCGGWFRSFRADLGHGVQLVKRQDGWYQEKLGYNREARRWDGWEVPVTVRLIEEPTFYLKDGFPILGPDRCDKKVEFRVAGNVRKHFAA